MSIGTIARIIFSITVVGGTIALSAPLSAHFRRGGYDLKGSKSPFKDRTNFCDPLYTPYRPPSMLGRPPWPSASFPSVKALAGFVKRRRHNAFSYIQYIHTHTDCTYKGGTRGNEKPSSMIARRPHRCDDEKLTPRDLSTDSIVLKCISHRSGRSLREKYTVMCADISRRLPGRLHLFTYVHQ